MRTLESGLLSWYQGIVKTSNMCKQLHYAFNDSYYAAGTWHADHAASAE